MSKPRLADFGEVEFDGVNSEPGSVLDRYAEHPDFPAFFAGWEKQHRPEPDDPMSAETRALIEFSQLIDGRAKEDRLAPTEAKQITKATPKPRAELSDQIEKINKNFNVIGGDLSGIIDRLEALDDEIKSLRSELDQVKAATTFVYKGVWQEGTEYQPGTFITCAGSLWHANTPTKAKPGTDGSWRLAVKRGRDGKDAR